MRRKRHAILPGGATCIRSAGVGLSMMAVSNPN